MLIKVLSDTHGFHEEEPLDKVDILIHCGDASNSYEVYANEREFLNFWNWWENYPAKYKVYVPGNHDSIIESSMSKILKKNLKENYWILIDKTIIIEGIKIFGSPYTPTFGNWSFMVDRAKIHKHWSLIEEDTDIIITHGPPKYVLDKTRTRDNYLEAVGDKSLLRIVNEIKPKYHFFGHIHGNKYFENNGTLIRNNISFVNCSQVLDGQLNGLKYFGKIIEINEKD